MVRNHLSRRTALLGLGAGLVTSALPARGADGFADASEFGLDPAIDGDQSAALQAAIDAAAKQGRTLLLPAGSYSAHDINLHGSIRGVTGQTLLLSVSDAPVGRVANVTDAMLEGLSFSGGTGSPGDDRGLLGLEAAERATIRDCFFTGSAIGLSAYASSATIENCSFTQMGDAAIHSSDSLGLTIRGNRISDCGNAGIRIWRNESGRDGSIVTGNRIERIGWVGGGNGQNGNGVNVFKADDVIVSDNVIADCAFTAVRVNSANNTQVRGNTCLNAGEVAIFSEFAFSGSVIADNIIDGAASGISITNLDQGGRLATCTGNIVRNIAAKSEVNPDARPVGIYAEADTVIADNAIDNVPGIGVLAGWGPFVRNLVVADNVISAVDTGIGVSVVQDTPAGPVRVSGNIITAREATIVGMEWEKVVSDDLARDAARYPNVAVLDNTVAPAS
ncbi:MAG TPA: TIGR03808 family TAT-translocated repetitive protein [Devosia sp.]|nr:TIGR03808 family TAT-translocated repetitive protein [Devosia sp.]